MLREELTRLKQLPQTGLPLVDVPQTQSDVQALLQETRRQGLGRVVHSLLPGVGGFCAPVYDAQGRLALGLVVLGSVATLDTGWDGAPATALQRCAKQLSADLGHCTAA
jgi:DNA-binding IclR family transcriptional regulator